MRSEALTKHLIALGIKPEWYWPINDPANRKNRFEDRKIPYECQLVIFLTEGLAGGRIDRPRPPVGVPMVQSPSRWSEIVLALQMAGLAPDSSAPLPSPTAQLVRNTEALRDAGRIPEVRMTEKKSPVPETNWAAMLRDTLRSVFEAEPDIVSIEATPKALKIKRKKIVEQIDEEHESL